MQLKGPKNIKSIVDDINRQLAGVKVDIAVNMPTQTITKIQKVSTGLKQVSVAAKKAETDVERFGAQIARSIERYGAFTVATTGFVALIAKITSGISETIKFQRELVRIAQVSGQTLNNLKGLSDEVTRLSKAYGVSSNVILESAVTLSQAGLSAKNVKVALESLAQTGIASTFGNIKDTTEASIAAMQQFGYETKDLGRLLSSINKVSAQFAIESDDITTGLRRAGSAFQAAGGDVNQFLGVLTAVRQTTRESAETISTGLRTIFARLQRPKTQNFLQSLGIDVLNDQNQFVGGFQAIKRISQALKQIPSTDIRYARVAEEVAGIRQINKFIPLIEKFDIAEKAVNVSIRSGTSLMDDAKKAQEAWAIQIERVNQAFLELLRTFANNNEVKFVASVIFNMAESFLKLATSLETVLPYIVAFSGVKIAQGLTGISKGFTKEIFKGAGSKTAAEASFMFDDSRLTNFSRGGGSDIKSAAQANKVREEFISSLGKFGQKNKGNFGGIGPLSEYLKYDNSIDPTRTRGVYSPKFNKTYLNNSATTKTVEHEFGHNTDFILGNKTHYASTNKNTFQYAITEKLKPLLKKYLDGIGLFDKDHKTYRLKNTEIFADLMANANKELRQILVSTTDAKLGMKRLQAYLNSNPTNLGGLIGVGQNPPNKPPNKPPTNSPPPPPPPPPPGPNGNSRGSGKSLYSRLSGVGNFVASASNSLAENGLTNFFALSAINSFADSMLGAESAISNFTKMATVSAGQFSILAQLFKGLSGSAQLIGESSIFGGAFSKAGTVGESTTRRVFKEESRKLTSIALGERFGLTGGDFEKASVSDLVAQTRLSKSQQNTAYRNYAIDEFLKSIGQTRGGRSYNDIEAKIKSNPALTRAFNKIKKSLTDADKTQALKNAQLEIFEGVYGKNATKESVTAKSLTDLNQDPNYKARKKAERAEARNFAIQKGEAARIAQRNLEGRGERGVAIANAVSAGVVTGSTLYGGYLTNQANKRLSAGEDARTQSAFGAALSAGGTAAGVGLSAGFALGGPAGAAIGAAAAGIPVAIYSFTTALQEAADKLQNVKFEESFEKLNKKIQNVVTGKLDAGNAISTNNIFFRDAQRAYASGSVDVRTNIRSNIQNNADSFETLFGKIADTTKSFADFEKVTGTSLSVFARLSDIPYQELKKKIEDQIKANEKLTIFNDNLAQAFQEQTIRLNNINDLIGAMSSVGVKQSDISQGIERIAGFAGGGSSSQSLGSRLGLFDAAKEGRGDLSSFARIVNNVSGNIGGPAVGVGTEAIFASKIAKELPNILLGLQKGNPLDANGGVIDQLEDALNKVAKDVGYGGTELQRAIIASASEILGTGEDEGRLIGEINKDLNGTISKLSAGLGNSADVFKDLVSLINDNVEELKKGFAKYYDVVDQGRELEIKRQGVLFSAFQTRNEFFDRETPLSAKLGFNQRRLGLISGQADNTVGGLRGTILRSQGNITQLDEAIKANLGTKNQLALEGLRAKEVDTLNRANKALEDLATNSDNLSAIQDEIAKEQNKNRLKKEGLNTLVYGNKDDRKEFAKSILLTAFAATNPLGIDAIPQNLRGNVKDLIDRAGDGNLFGEKAKDLDKRLSKQAGVNAGVNLSIAEQITSGITPAIAELIKKFDEQVKIQSDAINAQIGLNTNVAESLKTALTDANKAFLDNLQKIFLENQNERKATQNAEVKNNIDTIQKQIGLRNNLSRGVVSGINIGTKNLGNLAGAIPELERYGNLRETKNKLLSDTVLAKNIISATPVNRLNNEISAENIDKLINNIESQTGFKIDEKTRSKLQFTDLNGQRASLDKGYVSKFLNQSIDREKESQLKTVNKDIEETTKTLAELGVNAQALTLPFARLNELIKALQQGFAELNQIPNPAGLEARLKAEQAKQSQLGFASGGRVPGSGNFDSVPAMLTPGEFVLKKAAVQAIGLENLYAMNDIQTFAKGGSVKDRIAARIQKRQDYIAKLKANKANGGIRSGYRFSGKNQPSDYDMNMPFFGKNGAGVAQGNRAISREQYERETAYTPTRRRLGRDTTSPLRKRFAKFANGGAVEGGTGFDTSFISRLDNVLTSFSGTVDRLVSSLQTLNGMTINMAVRHDVNVVFNGAETLGRLMPELRDLAVSAAKQEINKMIDTKFPDVGRI